MIMRGDLRLTTIGLVAGLALAVAAAQLIRTLLFDVQPFEPMVYGAAAFLFFAVATLACLLPSVRGVANRSATGPASGMKHLEISSRT